MSHLRVGLSGCGHRGAEVVRLIRTHDDCDVVALHDVDAAALARLGNETAINSRHTDFDAMLATGVDFVVLTGSPGERLAQVQAVTQQGVHCCVHAPMALDGETADRMVTLAETAGVKLGVVVPMQAEAVLDQLRVMLADDWIGAPTLLTALCADDRWLRHPPPPGHWMRDAARSGEHAAQQLGTEHLHLASWLTGRAPLSATAQSAKGFSALAEDAVVATVMLRGGLLCTFAASHLARGSAFAIHGTDGAIRIARDRIALIGRKAWAGDAFDYPEPNVEMMLVRQRDQNAAVDRRFELHGRFARWIDDCDDFPCPGDQAALDLRALDAIVRAARTGCCEAVR